MQNIRHFCLRKNEKIIRKNSDFAKSCLMCFLRKVSFLKSFLPKNAIIKTVKNYCCHRLQRKQ